MGMATELEGWSSGWVSSCRERKEKVAKQVGSKKLGFRGQQHGERGWVSSPAGGCVRYRPERCGRLRGRKRLGAGEVASRSAKERKPATDADHLRIPVPKHLVGNRVQIQGRSSAVLRTLEPSQLFPVRTRCPRLSACTAARRRLPPGRPRTRREAAWEPKESRPCACAVCSLPRRGN